jgi:tetratricopeptide (TPR) repeat protein
VNSLHLLGQVTGDTLQIVRSIAINASILRRQGLLDSAGSLYRKALAIANSKAYNEQRKNILNSLGLLYTLEARYDIALKYHFESLKLRQQTPDALEISVALHNIGLVYYKLSNFDKALNYYEGALISKRQADSELDIDFILLNIGWCYIQKKEFHTARKYIDAAFSACGSNCSDTFFTDAYLMIGTIALDQREYSEAEKYFCDSYALAEKNTNVRYLFENMSSLSELYIATDKILRAENYLLRAEKLAEIDERYRLELANLYRQFSDLYGKTNNFKKKIYFQDKYIALKDSIFNEEVTVNLMKAESDYIERESKAKVEAQAEVMKLNDEIIFRQVVANIAFALVAVLAVALAIILARRVRAKQNANLMLDRKVIERTHELRVNQEVLQRALEEKALVVHKVTSELFGSIATSKGLCFLGRQETDVERSQDYWKRLDATTDGMRLIVGKLSQTENSKDQVEFAITSQVGSTH